MDEPTEATFVDIDSGGPKTPCYHPIRSGNISRPIVKYRECLEHGRYSQPYWTGASSDWPLVVILKNSDEQLL